MNALELADYLDADSENLTSGCTEAAAMLRKQHEAIKQLERENADLKAEVNRLLGIHKTLEAAWEAFSKFEDKKQPGRVIKFDNRFKK